MRALKITGTKEWMVLLDLKKKKNPKIYTIFTSISMFMRAPKFVSKLSLCPSPAVQEMKTIGVNFIYKTKLLGNSLDWATAVAGEGDTR